MNNNSIFSILGMNTKNLQEKLSEVKLKDYIKDSETINGMFDKLSEDEKKKVVDSFNKLSETFDDMFGMKSEKWTMDDFAGKNVKCETKKCPGLDDVTIVSVTEKKETPQKEETKKPESKPEPKKEESLKDKLKSEIKKEQKKVEPVSCDLKNQLMKSLEHEIERSKVNQLKSIVEFIRKTVTSDNRDYLKFHLPKDNVSAGAEITVPVSLLKDIKLTKEDFTEQFSFRLREEIAKVIGVKFEEVIIHPYETITVYIILK